MWHSFVVFVQFFGDSFNLERLEVNFEILLLPVILMHFSKDVFIRIFTLGDWKSCIAITEDCLRGWVNSL